MRRRQRKEAVPVSPLMQKLGELSPLTMEAAGKVLTEDSVLFLSREVIPKEQEVQEAVLALNRKRRRGRTAVSLVLLAVVAVIYLIDFIRDPSYVLALVLAALAAGLAVFAALSPRREAASAAKLYCEQVPRFSLCLFWEGLVFTDGADRTDLAPREELLWAETQELFACLVRGRGLLYLKKNMLSEEEKGFVQKAIEE